MDYQRNMVVCRVINWDIKKEIDGNQVVVNYDIKHGGRMSLNSTKQRKDYGNIMSVKNVIRNERPQGSYMLTILRVGIDSQRIDTIEITE